MDSQLHYWLGEFQDFVGLYEMLGFYLQDTDVPSCPSDPEYHTELDGRL